MEQGVVTIMHLKVYPVLQNPLMGCYSSTDCHAHCTNCFHFCNLLFDNHKLNVYEIMIGEKRHSSNVLWILLYLPTHILRFGHLYIFICQGYIYICSTASHIRLWWTDKDNIQWAAVGVAQQGDLCFGLCFNHGARFNLPIYFDSNIWILISHFKYVLITVHAFRQGRQAIYQF